MYQQEIVRAHKPSAGTVIERNRLRVTPFKGSPPSKLPGSQHSPDGDVKTKEAVVAAFGVGGPPTHGPTHNQRNLFQKRLGRINTAPPDELALEDHSHDEDDALYIPSSSPTTEVSPLSVTVSGFRVAKHVV